MIETETTYEFRKPVDDYLRVSTASPEVAIADPRKNVESIGLAYATAKENGAEILALPELCLTGYSAADMFFNSYVRENSDGAFAELAKLTEDGPAMVVGAPLVKDGLMYNCAVVLAEGKIIGAVPKSHIPNQGEFYERRWFTSGKDIVNDSIKIEDQEIPFGVDLIFEVNNTKVGIEICEDAFAVIPPSAKLSLAGADMVINISASNELAAKLGRRRALIAGHAANFLCGYAYVSAGKGESFADIVYGGHQMIAELGRISAEVVPPDLTGQSLTYDIDRTYIQHDRIINKTWAEQAAEFRIDNKYRVLPVSVPKDLQSDSLLRKVDKHPFVPKNPESMDERCEAIFKNMAFVTAQDVEYYGSKAFVIGLSGGRDSLLAALTLHYACEIMGEDPSFINALVLPGPPSSDTTQNLAVELGMALGATTKMISIEDLVQQTLAAIGHDGVTQDITYENVQARIRKGGILLNYANMVGGMDVGTGDMSENAQGYCTFNGDHMSMFNPNTGVPKTLVEHLIRWYADNRADDNLRQIIYRALAIPVSAELTGDGDISQITEDRIGPYELHDFFLHESERHGSRPEKIAYLAKIAFEGVYDEPTIDKWLKSYYPKFTLAQSKRETMPNGPKIGPVALSPRGDKRMAPNTSLDWYK